MKQLSLFERKAVKWSLIGSFALGLYFVVMKYLGLVHELEYRLLNAVIMFTILYKVIKEYKYSEDSDFSYFSGLGLGLLTAFITSTIFALFGLLYLLVIDPPFMQVLIEKELFGRYLNPYLASFQIFIEGAASGFTFSYALMQYLKVPMLSKAKS
jgi:hypothetical protein